MVDHLADVADEPEMSHGQADELAWTAAMALEAAFTLATRAGDQSTLHEMLDEATRGLVDALDHGHDDSADWASMRDPHRHRHARRCRER